MPEIRIIQPIYRDKIKRAWDNCNYYGDTPSQKIIDFCGEEVIRELERRPLIDQGPDYPKGTIVYFERDGIAYHIYKGINERPRMQGKYGYNVYMHPNA